MSPKKLSSKTYSFEIQIINKFCHPDHKLRRTIVNQLITMVFLLLVETVVEIFESILS